MELGSLGDSPERPDVAIPMQSTAPGDSPRCGRHMTSPNSKTLSPKRANPSSICRLCLTLGPACEPDLRGPPSFPSRSREASIWFGGKDGLLGPDSSNRVLNPRPDHFGDPPITDHNTTIASDHHLSFRISCRPTPLVVICSPSNGSMLAMLAHREREAGHASDHPHTEMAMSQQSGRKGGGRLTESETDISP
jgi:hypothetical protein